MDKIARQTADLMDENIARVAELFPNVVTEVEGEDGETRRAIDFDALREQLGDVAEGGRERYQFTWPGKREARAEARRSCDKTFRPQRDKSKDWDTTQNLYIEGDNLEALKLLRNTYAGKIKMIYIDPPYNTGHDFIYDDDFAQSRDEYNAENGEYTEEGGRLVANPESNGRFHSDWCSMMYPRLLLARDLLSEDGVIFVSMDDNELGNLKSVCDEVFGQDNHVATFLWTKTSTPPSLSYKSRKTVEYIFAVERSRSSQKYYGAPLDGGSAPLLNSSNPTKTLIFPAGCIQFGFIHEGVIPSGLKDSLRVEDEIRIVDGCNADDVVLSGKFKWTQSTLEEELASGTVILAKTDKMSIRFQREPDGAAYKVPINLIELNAKCDVGTNESAVKELDALRMKDLFDFPKPTSLVKKLVDMVVHNDRDSIVLDFFSGSATTAHAVMQLNAEDGGSRKFIMVQLPEKPKEDSEADRAGYATICEIGEERIRRAGEKIREEVEAANAQLKLGDEPKKVPDIGFRVLKIDSSNFEDVYATPADTQQSALFDMADNLKPGRTAEDLLFQVMPQLQIPLSAPIKQVDLAGFAGFSVDDDLLVACFDEGITNECITAMAERKPSYAVVRDASFAGDAAAANFEQIFKTVSSATICKVI